MSGRLVLPFEPLPRKRGKTPAWTVEGGEAWVRCNCGKWLALDHEIADDGSVSPSLVHEYEDGGCGWHVHVTLGGWPAPQEDNEHE